MPPAHSPATIFPLFTQFFILTSWPYAIKPPAFDVEITFTKFVQLSTTTFDAFAIKPPAFVALALAGIVP